MGEQRADAGLLPGFVAHVLRLPVLQRDFVEPLHLDGPEGLAIGNSEAQRDVIGGIHGGAQQHHGEKRDLD